MLLAGGGVGNDSISSNDEPVPGSPGIGSLIATGRGDGENQNQQQTDGEKTQIIIVNQDKQEPEEEQQQIIVVNQDQGQQQQDQGQQQQDQQQDQGQQQQDQGQQQQQTQGQENQNQQQEQNKDQENQEQKITIIEEEVIEYVPPADPEPVYAASTASLTTGFTTRVSKSNYITGNHRGEGSFASGSTYSNDFSYWLEDNATGTTFTNVNGGSSSARNLEVGGILENAAFDPSDRGFKYVCESGSIGCQYKNSYLFPKPNSGGRISAVYSKTNGFSGIYTYEGRTGNITGDVSLDFKYYSRSNNKSVSISGAIKGKEGPQGNSIIMNGDNFGMIAITVSIDPKTGTFNTDDHPYGSNPFFAEQRQYDHAFKLRGAFKANENINSGTVRSVKGSFSNDGVKGNDKDHLPNHIAGEVRMEGFYQGSDSTGSQYNKLVGVFVGDKK